MSTSNSLANDGNVYLDRVGGNGGSSLTLAGALSNSGSLRIGNTKLSASDKVTAASLDNTSSINLIGSSANQALLDVTGSAGFGTARVLGSTIELAGDSAIEFASGQISTIAAFSHLYLSGDDAFIEDSNALGSNSALTGLTDVAGSLTLSSTVASVSTTRRPLAIANNGSVDVDPGNDGGSSLTVAGALTNCVGALRRQQLPHGTGRVDRGVAR